MSIDHNPTPTLTVIPNIFDRDREQSALIPGQTVFESLPEIVRPDGSWVVVENGRVLSPEEWQARLVTPATELTVYPVVDNSPGMRIGIGVALIALAILSYGASLPANVALMAGAMGAGLVLGGVQQLMMAPPQSAITPSLTSDNGGSPTYGFGGITNSTRIGAPIPIVFGRHSAFPPIDAVEYPSAWMDVKDLELKNEPIISDEFELMEAA